MHSWRVAKGEACWTRASDDICATACVSAHAGCPGDQRAPQGDARLPGGLGCAPPPAWGALEGRLRHAGLGCLWGVAAPGVRRRSRNNRPGVQSGGRLTSWPGMGFGLGGDGGHVEADDVRGGCSQENDDAEEDQLDEPSYCQDAAARLMLDEFRRGLCRDISQGIDRAFDTVRCRFL